MGVRTIEGRELLRAFRTEFPYRRSWVYEWARVREQAADRGVRLTSADGGDRPVVGAGFVASGTLLDLALYVGKDHLGEHVFSEIVKQEE